MKPGSVHINCDLGEGIAWEEELFPYIHACNIACGGHFGTEVSIEKTMLLAKEHQVLVGAHPSYPDLEHFGRKSMQMKQEEFKERIQQQLDLYFRVLKQCEMRNNHIKPHGALYNDLCSDEVLAVWFLDAIEKYDIPQIYAPHQSVIALQATKRGKEVAYEAFLDRNYAANGNLVPRSSPHALKQLPEEVWAQLKRLIERGEVVALDGTILSMKADTLCIHGDDKNALENLRFIKNRLKEFKL